MSRIASTPASRSRARARAARVGRLDRLELAAGAVARAAVVRLSQSRLVLFLLALGFMLLGSMDIRLPF
jgi:hypothetical protein